jgi:hypothetical protein
MEGSLYTKEIENSLSALRSIRDEGPLSSRNSSKGSLLKEAFTAFSAVREGLQFQDLKRTLLEGGLLFGSAYETRRTIWRFLQYRYLSIAPRWIGHAMADATERGLRSSEFVSLAYLYFALRDRLAFDFITGPVWEKWQRRETSLSSTDFLLFMEKKAILHPEIKTWRDITRNRLASSNLAALRDFGLLRGIKKKDIQRPSVAHETVFHLVCLLLAEGRHGRAIIEAPDWRLFLWTEGEVVAAIGVLAQRRWVNFEKGGRAVILDLIRLPEFGQ